MALSSTATAGFAPLSGPWMGALAQVALYPYGLSACQVLSHYDLATTGTYTLCPPAGSRRPYRQIQLAY